jgi:multidrug efflux pump subunit AcrA (membrane-fusion protein)
MTAPTRLTPERLARLNKLSPGLAFDVDDREDLTALIQLAGDRLEEIDALRDTVRTLEARLQALDRYAFRQVKDLTQAQADLAALRQAHARLQAELETLRACPMIQCTFEQRAERAEARWQVLKQKVADFRAGTVVNGKSKAEAAEVATIQATLNVVECEMAALDPSRPTPKDGE